jgi:hypothetical protein
LSRTAATDLAEHLAYYLLRQVGCHYQALLAGLHQMRDLSA